jgi:hypothetical protein
VFGVDDIDGSIGTIGEIVGLGCLVYPTNIKGEQAARTIADSHGDRNDLEQPDGRLMLSFVLVVPVVGTTGTVPEQQARYRDREKQEQEQSERARSHHCGPSSGSEPL